MRDGPILRFSPIAWSKLLYLRDRGETEVGAFGISASADLLQVLDIQLVEQSCGWASVVMDDQSVANFFDEQVDLGRRPEQFARIWVHTHPGACPRPSGVDEETFARVFGRSDWSVMFILARGGATYARMQFGVGPGGSIEIPMDVDYSVQCPATDFESWNKEYLACVRAQPGLASAPIELSERPEEFEHQWQSAWQEYLGADDEYLQELLS